MDISVINEAGVENKYIRLALWKLYRLEEKFPNLKGSQLTILKENPRKNVFRVMLKLRTMGETIVLKQQAKSISKIINNLKNDAHEFLYNQQKLIQFYNPS
jgi:hypothetical protein